MGRKSAELSVKYLRFYVTKFLEVVYLSVFENSVLLVQIFCTGSIFIMEDKMLKRLWGSVACLLTPRTAIISRFTWTWFA